MVPRVINFIQRQEAINPPRRRKFYRHPVNYLNQPFATDEFLRKHFRFDHESILKICELISDEIQDKIYLNGRPICLQIQVLKISLSVVKNINKVQTALLYLGHHSHQILVARHMKISQKSVSRCIHNVCKALAKKASQIITFPRPQEFDFVKRNFLELAGFPGVVGAIDCTHIKILVNILIKTSNKNWYRVY